MILQVFSVLDTATASYGTPMFMVSAGAMVRSFSDEVNRDDPNNQLNRHPSDFICYSLGQFDSDNGSFTSHEPVILIRAADVIKG
ncbi:MAG: nonstructural protein [Microvirus sp.]|nr:MAG: nonstructural protein [Microvirus sp.]